MANTQEVRSFNPNRRRVRARTLALASFGGVLAIVAGAHLYAGAHDESVENIFSDEYVDDQGCLMETPFGYEPNLKFSTSSSDDGELLTVTYTGAEASGFQKTMAEYAGTPVLNFLVGNGDNQNVLSPYDAPTKDYLSDWNC